MDFTISTINNEFKEIYNLYQDMKDINIMHNKQQKVDYINTEFKILLNNFKKKYSSIDDIIKTLQFEQNKMISRFDSNQDKIDELIIINNKINEIEANKNTGIKRIETLKLFDEKYIINTINEKNENELSVIIENPVIFEKNSASKSFIFRAKYFTDQQTPGKACYIKAFFADQNNLLYEQKIYNYIKTRNENIKEYFEEYFVKVYDNLKVKNNDFKIFLNKNKFNWTTVTGQSLLANLNNTKYKYIYLIITEDTGGITYEDFFKQNYENEKLVINTLFDMIYGIYLMNNKLKLMHNDNHFGNVLIIPNLSNTECKYQIENVEYTKMKNFRLCFYDFDQSYLQNFNNPSIASDNSWVIQNKFSAKDIWSVVNSILRTIYYKIDNINHKEYLINTILNNNIYRPEYWNIVGNRIPYNNLNFYSEIINLILNNDDNNILKLEQIYVDSRETESFWNANCINNNQKICEIPDEKSLYPLNVLNRLIANYKIMKKLNFIQFDGFYTKYLKYKTKYFELKKLI